jgi:hypothetical protein
MAWMGNWFGNPKGIVARSPGLAPCAYPGKGVGGFVNPNGVVPGPRLPPDGPQPRWGCCPIGRSPRVAPLAQPWAWRRNPVGIRAGNLAGRNLFDWFEADACKVQTIHPSCAHGGQPSSQVKPSQGQGRSSLVKPLALPGPETRDPRPETRNPKPEKWVKVSQGQSSRCWSSLVQPPPDPRPETQDPKNGSNPVKVSQADWPPGMPEVLKSFFAAPVAQVSKPAVSPISKSADHPKFRGSLCSTACGFLPQSGMRYSRLGSLRHFAPVRWKFRGSIEMRPPSPHPRTNSETGHAGGGRLSSRS